MVYATNARPELIKWLFFSIMLNWRKKKKYIMIIVPDFSLCLSILSSFTSCLQPREFNFCFFFNGTHWNKCNVFKTISTWSHVQFIAESANKSSVTKMAHSIKLASKESKKKKKRICVFQTGNFTEKKYTHFFSLNLITSAIDCFLSKTGRIYIHFDLAVQFIKRVSCIIALFFFPLFSHRSVFSLNFNWFHKIGQNKKKITDFVT